MCWIWRGSTDKVYPDSCNLKLSNRPVRARMPGGVAGEQAEMPASYADTTRFSLRPSDEPDADDHTITAHFHLTCVRAAKKKSKRHI